ncbi:MAG: hypothetical protein ACE5KZ_01210 [Candidatus Scalinduaceae bacterium]
MQVLNVNIKYQRCDPQPKKSTSTTHLAYTIILSLLLLSSGCGPSYEERRSQEEAERKERVQKSQKEERLKIDELKSKYSAVYFLPQNLGVSSFTYEIQKFMEAHSKNPILFKGYLEDIEKTENDIVVEFLCPYVNKTTIRFRLTASEDNVKQFLGAKREGFMFRSFRYFSEPDYFVVAKIDELNRSRTYELYGSTSGYEVNKVVIPPSFISTGELVEAIPIPNFEEITEEKQKTAKKLIKILQQRSLTPEERLEYERLFQ